MQTAPLRFGYTGSVQLLPLLYPLLAGWVEPSGRPIAWEDRPAADLLAALDAGDLDAALVSPVAYARRRADLTLLPGVGLASEGPTAAAVLQSATRPDLLDGQAIRLAGSSIDDAGAALLVVLMRPYYGVERARWLATDETPTDGTPPAGRQLSGDAAVAARRPWLLYEAYLRTIEPIGSDEPPHRRPPVAPVAAPDPAVAGHAEDLGAAWWVLTGVPVVWMLGVVRRPLVEQDPALPGRLIDAFALARRTAGEQWPSVLAAAAARVDLPEPAVAALFAPQVTTLGPREMGALDAYYTYTRRLRLTR